MRDKQTISNLLNDTGLAYDILEDGTFMVHIEFDDNRKQEVFINGQCEVVNDVEFRNIWSPALEIKQGSLEKIAVQLLSNNHHRIAGSWVLDPNEKIIYFSAKLIDNFNSKELDTVVTAIASDADRLEQKIKGEDIL